MKQPSSRLRFAPMIALVGCVGFSTAARAQCELTRVTVDDGVAKQRFGWSTAISGDYAVVGTDEPSTATGAAYLFERDGLSWIEIGRLVPALPVLLANDDEYGRAVAISGSVAVVGARKRDLSGLHDRGAVYVFRRNSSTGVWEYEQELLALGGAEGDLFASSLAIDGDWIVAGAPNSDEFGDVDAGAAYAFYFDGTSWAQQRKFRASDQAERDQFANAVAINGNWVVVGAKADGDSCPGGPDAVKSGSVYTFFHDPSAEPNAGWEVRTKLQAQFRDGDTVTCDAAFSDAFGHSVAVNGGRLVVGAIFNDDAGISSGSAYVYRLDEADWVIEQKLTASDAAASDNFGRAVALEGDLVLVGASKGDSDNPSIANTGAVYLYHRSGASWVDEVKLTSSDSAENDRFGWFVSISGDFAAVGAYLKDTSTGAAYIFAIVGESDCNKNGLLDDCEILGDSSLDSNNNGVLDSCECATDDDCIGALACLSGTCDQDTGLCVFTVNAGACAIAGVCFDNGALNPDNDCQLCEHAAGDSDWTNRADGLSCGDSSDSTCDRPDVCDGEGLCHANPEPAGTVCVDDGNECTNDLCGGAGACGHPNVADSTPCRNDGIECTVNLCLSGQCARLFQSDGTPCGDQATTECEADDSCDGAGNCRHNFRVDGTPCGDQSSTACDSPDICDGAGNCVDNSRDDGTPCFHDGLFCTGEDTCQGGACESAGDPCTEEGLICDGFAEFWNQCSCDPAIEDICSDGIFCNGVEICNFGACVSSGAPCGGTGLHCDEATDICKCLTDADCEDGDECLGVESCDAGGVCRHTLVSDCNANGLEDACDLDSAGGASLDCNDDGVPDECELDLDGDGFIDDCDACPDSDLDKLIAVGECPTGVPNVLLDDGCSMNDVLRQCSVGAHSHGELTACLVGHANEWRRGRLLSGKDVGRIAHCAGTSNESRPSKRIKDVQSPGKR